MQKRILCLLKGIIYVRKLTEEFVQRDRNHFLMLICLLLKSTFKFQMDAKFSFQVHFASYKNAFIQKLVTCLAKNLPFLFELLGT